MKTIPMSVMQKRTHLTLRTTLAILCAAVACSTRSVARDLILVEDGKPACVIVADANLGPSEITAVKELQKYLAGMSGARIEVTTPEQATLAPSQTKIVVGHATLEKLYPSVSLNGLGTDGFVLKTEGNALLVGGGEKRGTLYAAYELLESLGCRWWAVGATHIPEKSTLSVGVLNVRHVPTLEYRDMLYGIPYLNDAESKASIYAHHKINGFMHQKGNAALGGRVEFADSLVHTWASLMKPVGELDGSFKTHPEYYSLRNGKRIAAQVCTSEPMVFEIMLANVRRLLKDNPNYAFVVVGQEDNNNFCQCEECAKFAESEESQAAPGLRLANKIAEVVEQEFPGKWVMAPAYTWSRKPPKNLKPGRNVGITLCTIECDFNRPIAELSTPKNKAFAEDIISWSKIAPKLYIWDYTTDFNHYLMPFPNLDALVPNIQFLVAHGVKGILAQGSHNTPGAEFDTLRMWVLGKALWNPEKADGPALIKEFTTGYYGAAAPFIQSYIDIMHAPGRANPAMAATCYSQLDSEWLAPEVIAAAEAALRGAELAVKDQPDFFARVQHARLPIWYILLKRGPQSKTWAATEAKNGKLDIVAMVEAFAKSCAEWKFSVVSEGNSMDGFLAWAKAYAARAASAVPLPPELVAADPKTYRLIQASQMDARGRWWIPEAGASDGWVCEIPSVGWTVFHEFSHFDDAIPGKSYKVFIRRENHRAQTRRHGSDLRPLSRDQQSELARKL